ncbi:hypothetical protein DFH09DRAFT_934652, partial [Mycena vulgaris]
ILKLKGPTNRRGHDECMKDTRVDILKIIDEWINDSTGPNVFWLHGHPGTGKSAIAATVRAHLVAAGRLGSSFFFRREDFLSQTPQSLWCSVAYDLAQEYPTIRRSVVNNIKLYKIDPVATSHDEIFDKLIRGPLGVPPSIATGRLPIIVIDALDECGGLQNAIVYQAEVLRALVGWQSLPVQFKMFVTSRNEGKIQSILGTGGPRCEVLEVGSSATQDSFVDIKKYLKHNFDEIAAEFTTIVQPWPTESDLDLLANTAAGLFIWASTVINLVRGDNPKRELDRILEMVRSEGIHMSPQMDHLAQLYETLLTSKFQTPDQISRLTKVAGTVIVARTPMSPEDLVQLLTSLDSLEHHPQLNGTDLEVICKKLKSVLDIQSGLRFLHQSFVDFLLNLPSDSKFHCKKEDHEEMLASACFVTMGQKLHFNMAHIPTSYMRNKDLLSHPEQSIAPELHYSCQFWATHLRHVGSQDFLIKQVRNFMHKRLLFWLEVMSILGETGSASALLNILLTWEPVSGTFLF